MKVFKSTPAGKEVILEIFGAGDPLGAVAVYESATVHGLGVHARTYADPAHRAVGVLPPARTGPAFVRGLLSGLTIRLAELTRRLAELSGARVEARFARLFLKLCRSDWQRGARRRLRADAAVAAGAGRSLRHHDRDGHPHHEPLAEGRRAAHREGRVRGPEPRRAGRGVGVLAKLRLKPSSSSQPRHWRCSAPQHDQEHARRGAGIDRVRHVGRHANDVARARLDGVAVDGQDERSLQHQHERLERRRMLGQALAGSECEQGHAATAAPGEHAAGDPVLGRRDQIDKAQGFSRGNGPNGRHVAILKTGGNRLRR